MTDKLTDQLPLSVVLKHVAGELPALTHDQLLGFWYDWFCKDTSLANKSIKLLGYLSAIRTSRRFDPEKCYVFFKNNCPGNGSLYDDFRICSLATGDVIFCVVPHSGHDSIRGESEVWGKAADGTFKEIVHGTWSDVKKFFKSSDAEWAKHTSSLPVSPFQTGVEVHVIGEHVPFGDMPKRQVVGAVNDQGVFHLVGNEFRWFKKDGSCVIKAHHRRGSRTRSYQCELWTEYEAKTMAEDERRIRREQSYAMKREIDNAMCRIGQGGDVESHRQWTMLRDFVVALVPQASVKKVA